VWVIQGAYPADLQLEHHNRCAAVVRTAKSGHLLTFELRQQFSLLKTPMSELPQKRKRLTVEQKNERADFAQREAKTREWLSTQAARANKIRSKDKEFHGLEREFMNLQAKMLSDYEISKDIKHPRDVGTVREVLLRDFFLKNKLLPRRYSVSDASVRVASTSGHLSNEIDILFYDAMESFTLMQRQGVYEVLPVEYCYGAIQVKSKLTKGELKNAFSNIESFKRLHRINAKKSPRIDPSKLVQNEGFGIIFAYDTDMAWEDLVAELRSHARTCERSVLPNAVFILSKGSLHFGGNKFGSIYNSHIEAFGEIDVYGNPDRQGLCLYSLYSTVFELLINTRAQEALPRDYFRLPLTAGNYSYSYSMGNFAEFGHCGEHGDYARVFTPEKLAHIIDWCQTAEPINWIKATDLAYGKTGDNTRAYERQPGDVRIYNPKNLPLSEILIADRQFTRDGKEVTVKALAFDCITSNGINIYIPYYYQIAENLIEGCAKCNKL